MEVLLRRFMEQQSDTKDLPPTETMVTPIDPALEAMHDQPKPAEAASTCDESSLPPTTTSPDQVNVAESHNQPEPGNTPVHLHDNLDTNEHHDEFGELDLDEKGELRYIGIHSTITVVDICSGLRRHITRGLQQKGYSQMQQVFASPEVVEDQQADSPLAQMEHSMQGFFEQALPPALLMDVLIDHYFERMHRLLPFTNEDDFRTEYVGAREGQGMRTSFAAILFSILAVSTWSLDVDLAAFSDVDKGFSRLEMSKFFHSVAVKAISVPRSSRREIAEHRALDTIATMGLIAVYHSQLGSHAEAWITVGRSIRVAQDIGLHRSPSRLNLPHNARDRRRYIWWSLYILDRQLSTSLGRPLAIDDSDCDVEFPEADLVGLHSHVSREFFMSQVQIQTTIGCILKTVNSVKNARNWHETTGTSPGCTELRQKVKALSDELQNWVGDKVPADIKTAKNGPKAADKCIALSTYFCAILLLYRGFMANPHKPSPLEGSQALLQCARASTNCITISRDFLSEVPKSHFHILHGQYVFISIVLLLHCIRVTTDPAFVSRALEDVERGIQILKDFEPIWPDSKKCRGVVEEYIEFSLHILEKGKRGKCSFQHGSGEVCSHAATTNHTSRKRPSTLETCGSQHIQSKRPKWAPFGVLAVENLPALHRNESTRLPRLEKGIRSGQHNCEDYPSVATSVKKKKTVAWALPDADDSQSSQMALDTNSFAPPTSTCSFLAPDLQSIFQMDLDIDLTNSLFLDGTVWDGGLFNDEKVFS